MCPAKSCSSPTKSPRVLTISRRQSTNRFKRCRPTTLTCMRLLRVESIDPCPLTPCRYLIHIPFFAKSEEDFQRAWKTMEGIQKAGKARSIGVSNYMRPHIEATLKGATSPPVTNQIEYHAYLQRGDGYVAWLQDHEIQVGSFKGLTPAFRAPDGPLRAPLARIAKAHGVTEAAVLISWILRNDVVAVTTTTKVERLDEYAQALKIKLTEDEVKEITDVGATYHFRTSWGERFAEDDRS